MEDDPKLTKILQLVDFNSPFISWLSKSIYKEGQQNRMIKSIKKEQTEMFIN